MTKLSRQLPSFLFFVAFLIPSFAIAAGPDGSVQVIEPVDVPQVDGTGKQNVSNKVLKTKIDAQQKAIDQQYEAIKKTLAEREQALAQFEADDKYGISVQQFLDKTKKNEFYNGHKKQFDDLNSRLTTAQQQHDASIKEIDESIERVKQEIHKKQGLLSRTFRSVIGSGDAQALWNDVEVLRASKVAKQKALLDDLKKYKEALDAKVAELKKLSSEKDSSELFRQAFGGGVDISRQKFNGALAGEECGQTLFPDGMTALMLAAKNSQNPNIEELNVYAEKIKAGTLKIDAKDDFGKTALRHAMDANNPVMVKWLLAHGASPNSENVKDLVGSTPLDTLLSKMNNSDFEESRKMKEMLIAVVKSDAPTEHSSFPILTGLLNKLTSPFSYSYPIRSVISELAEEKRGENFDPKFEAAFDAYITQKLKAGDVDNVKTLNPAKVRAFAPQTWWKNGYLMNLYPDTKKALGQMLLPNISEEERKTHAGVLLYQVIKQRGQFHSETYFNPHLRGLTDDLIGLAKSSKIDLSASPPKPDLSAGSDQSRYIANAAVQTGDDSLLDSLVTAGIKMNPQVKTDALVHSYDHYPRGEMVSAVFSHPDFQGANGEHFEAPVTTVINGKSSTTTQTINTLEYLSQSRNAYLLPNYLKTRKTIVLPADAGFLARPRYLSPEDANEMGNQYSNSGERTYSFLTELAKAGCGLNEFKGFIAKVPVGDLKAVPSWNRRKQYSPNEVPLAVELEKAFPQYADAIQADVQARAAQSR